MEAKFKRDNGTKFGIATIAVMIFLLLVVIGAIAVVRTATSDDKPGIVPANKSVTPDRVKAQSGANGDIAPSSSGTNPSANGSNSQLSNPTNP